MYGEVETFLASAVRMAGSVTFFVLMTAVATVSREEYVGFSRHFPLQIARMSSVQTGKRRAISLLTHHTHHSEPKIDIPKIIEYRYLKLDLTKTR